jgi:hypothetical protein
VGGSTARRLAIVGMAGALLVMGCSTEAERGADARAERAGIVMARERNGTAADMARRVEGTSSSSGTRIDVLVAEGDRVEGRIVLRITEVVELGPAPREDEGTVRCYEYELDRSIKEPSAIPCPDGDPIELPPPTTIPRLPDGLEEALRTALVGLGPERTTESAVLEVATRIAGSATVIEVAREGDVIGVVVGNGDDECVSALIDADGVQVWWVPPVMAAPGELGCSAQSAARGEGQSPPH